MVYPENFEDKINFSPLRELLYKLCRSSLGAECVRRMHFSHNFSEVETWLKETDEMLQIISSDGKLPVDNIFDVTQPLSNLKAEGSYLSSQEFLKLRKSLDTLFRVKKFFDAKDDDGVLRYRLLHNKFKEIICFPELISDIDRIISPIGDVKDTASEKLADIRVSISKVSSSLSSVMRSVIDRAKAGGLIDKDVTATFRDGRLVLPVASMSKRKIHGIVHDESASGKTVFIEPTEVVEVNNRLRELENEEQREIVRILISLADIIRPFIDEMLVSFSLLGEYDFIYAKAQLARRFDAQMPSMDRNPQIDWYHAVHPVLKMSLEAVGKEVVPLDLRLGHDRRILVISGPNAGGKSVCLKTVGVVQYMLQCGLLPTIYSNSHVSVFKNLLIDIGDEQSIENDLSTYSSHLRNMKVFLQNVSKSTLILADEMGSGTEPQIGGALAQSILARINQSGAMGIITTHYQNLKTFAEETPGFINGAMLYDRQKMLPLFQLSVGYPGSSFALEIARKTGLPDDVINTASEIVGSDYVNMDKYLLDLARDRRYWANKRQSIKEKEKRLDATLEKYESKAAHLVSSEKDYIKAAKQRAEEIVSEANARIERVIREIKEANAEKERTKQIRKELEEYKDSLKKQESAASHYTNKKSRKQGKSRSGEGKSVHQRVLKIDDYVRMSDGGTIGKILKIEGKKAEVLFGALRTFVALDKLEPANHSPQTKLTEGATLTKETTENIRRRQLNLKNEIDMRGMRVDEALQALTYFLDDALQFNLSRVRILHGTGTGALRMAVREQLQAHPNVKSFRDEDVRFGGAGITVVELD